MTSNQSLNSIEISKHLIKWFKSNKRNLPWRKPRQNPYLVWISEIMLQQTTTQAVRPYFIRFTEKWPSVSDLAKAKQEEVNEYWAGLGYYSRARNILKAAQIIDSNFNGKLPNTAEKLLTLPGIGPYTSRAISSICFNEKVGVVDGNVLRVYNRLLGQKLDWWKKSFFNSTQNFSDTLCQIAPPKIINPALMDLGSTICTPKKVMCSLCPLTKVCETFKKRLQNKLPLPRPRKKKEFWQYSVYKNCLGSKALYAINAKDISSPILKKNILPLGSFKKLKKKPKKYDFMHTITNHNLFIKFINNPKPGPRPQKTERIKLKRATPSSLIEKIWQHPNFYENI